MTSRSRKIRCDGAKPICHNCSKRTTDDSECNYDSIPKRRGPDKTPGARQRLARDSQDDQPEGGPVRRRRRRDTATHNTVTPEQRVPSDSRHRNRSDSESIVVPSAISLPTVQSEILASSIDFGLENNYADKPQNSLRRDMTNTSFPGKDAPISYDDAFDLSSIIPLDRFAQPHGSSHVRTVRPDDKGDEEEVEVESLGVSCEPSINFNRKIWWDTLLSLYQFPNGSHNQSLTTAQRESAAQKITSDIRFIFSTSNYWFSFFHISSFFGNYFDPMGRERIQPSLILALLAMSTFWQSSEIGLGSHGRERALRFRDEAQSALDASFNAGWIDETLAQAAWVCPFAVNFSHSC